jgi:hypothetical protein
MGRGILIYVIDNILRGLHMMMGWTLLGYSIIHLVLSIRKKFKS